MNEITISKNTASKIVKEYIADYYNSMVNIKVKPVLIDNDLYVVVKKQNKLNHKNISLTELLNEGAISNMIIDYMKQHDCLIDNIMYEPYFHNLIIRYHGNEFKLYKKKKGYEKVLVV